MFSGGTDWLLHRRYLMRGDMFSGGTDWLLQVDIFMSSGLCRN